MRVYWQTTIDLMWLSLYLAPEGRYGRMNKRQLSLGDDGVR